MVFNLNSFRKLLGHLPIRLTICLLCLLTFNFISFSLLSLPFARCVCHPCRHPHQLQCARQGPGCAQYDAYIQKYDHWCGDADAAAGKPHNGRHLLHCRCGGHPRGRWSLQQAGGAAHRCAYPITGHRLHAVSTRRRKREQVWRRGVKVDWTRTWTVYCVIVELIWLLPLGQSDTTGDAKGGEAVPTFSHIGINPLTANDNGRL